MARLIPLALAISIASSTACLAPETTIWPPPLSLATSHSAPRCGGRFAGDLAPPAPVPRRAGRPWRPRRPARPSAWPGRAGAAAARRRRSSARRRRRAPNIRRANGRRRKRASRATLTPFSVSSARKAARLTAISAGWALAVSMQFARRRLRTSRWRASGRARRPLRRTRRARREGVVKRLAHADGLGSLARKNECDRHGDLPDFFLASVIGDSHWRRAAGLSRRLRNRWTRRQSPSSLFAKPLFQRSPFLLALRQNWVIRRASLFGRGLNGRLAFAGRS